MNRRYVTGEQTCRQDSGFTLIELMVVVLIIGILVSIAIPVFNGVRANAERKACYANQRMLEGAAYTWVAQQSGDLDALAGPVDASHELVSTMIVRKAPRCPSAPQPPAPTDPDPGAYEFNAVGQLDACPFDGHGHY